MDFFKNEKNRIKFYYQKLLLGLLLFLYFIVLQSNVSTHKVIFGKGLDSIPLPLINPILLFGIIILTAYLNNKLFFIKEQGEKIFILRKYDIIPLTKKDMYIAKFKIIISYIISFILMSIELYIITMLINSYKEISILKNILEIFFVLIFSIFTLIIFFVLNLIQDIKSKKKS